MLHFPYTLIILMMLLLFMSLIGGSDLEGTVGVSKGVEDTNVKEGMLSVV